MSDGKGSGFGAMLKLIGGPLLIFSLLLLAWVWFFWRVHVPAGKTLVVTRVLGQANPDEQTNRVIPVALAGQGVKGIQERVYGEGNHFINPIIHDTSTSEPVLTLLPGNEEQPAQRQRARSRFRSNRTAPPKAAPVHHGPRIDQVPIAVVTAQSGQPLPSGNFLTDRPYFKGVLQRVLTPGSWRFNPHSHKVQRMPATIIPPGYAGVVTNQVGPETKNPDNLADEGQKGVMRHVLAAGIYFLNPKARKVTVFEIGYRQLSLSARDGTQITFPSRDGYNISCDITVVWGVHPENAPHIVQNIGPTDADIISKVINQAIQSASRNEGSQYSAAELVTGLKRKEFADRFTATLASECKSHRLDILIGLIRDISIPADIRKPIQDVQIHNERQQTIVQEELTQKEQNKLEQVKGDVLKQIKLTEAETHRMVAQQRQEGLKLIAETLAKGRAQVAKINLEVAQTEARIAQIKGEGQAKVEQLEKEAAADRFTQLVAAFGTPEAYTRFTFAQGLPDNFTVVLRYAGEGTFWTDLPQELKSLERAASLKILGGKKK